MNNKIDNSEIKTWIHEIIDTVGIREPVNYSSFVNFVYKDELTELIEAMGLYMNLPIKAEVEFINNQYQSGKINFESKNLTDYDSTGRNKAGIIAEVLIPGNLPLYGTSGLINYPIKIKVSNDCLDKPKMFITIMSHELTHVLLHSLRHKNKDNEFFTDLTAMTLGFVDIFNEGRTYSYETNEEHFLSSTITTHTSTCGYLSNTQFAYAWNLINKNLEGYRKSVKKLKDKYNKFEKSFKLYDRLFKDFNKYKILLDKNYSIKIKSNDALKIVSMHSADYMDHYHDFIKRNEIMLLPIKTNLKKIENNNLYCKKDIINCDQTVIKLLDEMEKESNVLKEDFTLLGKYVNIANKLKIRLGIS